MCGIVGALSFKNGFFEITEPYFERMRDTMTHRGAGATGVWVSTSQAWMFRALSTILSGLDRAIDRHEPVATGQ